MLNRRTSRRLLLALVVLAPAILGVHADDQLRVIDLVEADSARPAFAPNEVIVRFAVANDSSVAERTIRDIGGIAARRSVYGSHYLVTLEDGVSVLDTVARLRAMPEVDYAEPNGRMHSTGVPKTLVPNDPLYRLQWNMRMVDAERTWGIQTGDPSVVVAVVDTGIAFEDFGRFRKAPDWGGTVFATGYNVFTRDSHANDDYFHGTHVASTIAEATNNGQGVAGLAFGCALMPVKVLDSNGEGSFFSVAEGVDYAVNFTQNGVHPVKVINLSLGGDGFSSTMQQSLARAFSAGIVVVAAAGNGNTGTIDFPASLPNVIAVGAVDGRKQRARYSNFGKELSVVAPGGDVLRDDDGDGVKDGVLQQTFNVDTARLGRYDDFGYFLVNGTSQATPHVAALAALLVRQGITDPAAVKKAIESTAEDLGAAGRDDEYGWGLIRPSEALKGLGLNK